MESVIALQKRKLQRNSNQKEDSVAQSKYNSKASKRSNKPVRKVVAPGKPVFNCTSVCCGVAALKKPLLVDYDKEFKDREGHLGSWRCSNCKKKAKVTRTKVKAEEPVEVAA